MNPLAATILAVAVALVAARASAAELFVRPAGDDSASGTKDHPLKTFAAAQKAARDNPARGKEALTVWFAPGTYYLAATLTFTAADSGSPGAPVRLATGPTPPPFTRDSALNPPDPERLPCDTRSPQRSPPCCSPSP